MKQSLELKFEAEGGGTGTITINDPRLPVNPVAVKAAMEKIIEADIVSGSTGSFTAIKSVRLIGRDVSSVTV